jgi:hypothetical protein
MRGTRGFNLGDIFLAIVLRLLILIIESQSSFVFNVRFFHIFDFSALYLSVAQLLTTVIFLLIS